MADAADATPGAAAARPDRRRGPGRRGSCSGCATCPAAVVPDLPRGEGWLIVELAGDSVAEVARPRRRGVLADAGRAGLPGGHRRRPRRRRCGGSARTAPGWPAAPPTADPAHAGWEDAAVPAERLGAYLREFDALLAEHGLQGVPYGHFGDGCVHVRIDFPFGAASRTAAARASARSSRTPPGWWPRYGGSMSGEHGDGRARSELLPLMYSPAAIELFARVKAVFDPDDLLNPGVLVRAGAARRRHPRRRRRRRRRRAPGAGLPARRRRLRRGRAPLHRRGQVPGRPAGYRRRDVPVVPGHPRGEGLHPRPGPGAAGDARARRPGARTGARPRCTTRSTCACPARAAPATARPASTWPPTRPRCCTSPTGAGCGRARTTRWAGCRAGPASPPARPRLVNARARRPRLGGRLAKWSAGIDQRRERAAVRAADLPAQWAAPRGLRRRRRHRRWCCGSTRSPTTSPRRWRAPPRAVLEEAGYRVQVPGAEPAAG